MKLNEIHKPWPWPGWRCDRGRKDSKDGRVHLAPQGQLSAVLSVTRRESGLSGRAAGPAAREKGMSVVGRGYALLQTWLGRATWQGSRPASCQTGQCLGWPPTWPAEADTPRSGCPGHGSSGIQVARGLD